MAILVGHASLNENGKTTGGTAGDQTGAEVCTREWYSKPWDFMAIHPDATVREKHASAVEKGCANNKIGYDQNRRNTLNTQAAKVSYDLSKITTACDCDCSAFQNVCAVASGASGVTYGSNGWTTSTMKSKLSAAGYKIITSSTYLTNSSYCVRGAIYVKAGSHTVCGLTNGSNYSKTLSAAGVSTSTTTSGTTSTVSYYAKYTGSSTSIVSALNSLSINSTYAYRKKIAAANSISNYTGSASQNTTMLNLLKQGKLIKA